MKKVLVTGANGFIGKALIEQLNKLNQYLVTSLVRSPIDTDNQQVVVDLSDKKKVYALVRELEPNIVIHLASEKKKNTFNLDKFNEIFYDFEITKNLVEATLFLPYLHRFLFVGSCEEYGLGNPPFNENNIESPISTYSLSKTLSSNLLKYLFNVYQFPMTILRPSLVYGPGQGMEMFLPNLIKTLINRKKFLMSLGDQTRDFLFVDDLSSAILKTIEIDSSIGKIINLGSSNSYKLKDVAFRVANLIDENSKNLILLGALPYRESEIMEYQVDISLANSILDWIPNSDLDEGLRKTVDYYRNSFENA